ncbi:MULTISPECIES: DUF4202 domain-containing protein [unclassified Pseudoalteromonas]|uniref:DUF4202 domain-containing protein n=1 Tax=unclassified Pseudoalteromonas TaxID=194690 RepID=UPI000B3D159F|nr:MULTISPECIES: DUF4202 domain-containing protein [unclassified Pseudoalteromonas]MDN3380836.1 DUF4202 domain-containing protein [Pseudoalteromonas sp. APC 3893]MDN3389243.1 DUF4202 domain-containing protein [Pseudoalteromonas sp. APC 4017]OUS68416.1 hypothetical protein B5G52_19565 [Pseudoalteromonas sp. A601]
MFEQVITSIDKANKQDPNHELLDEQKQAKEHVYALRMTQMLNRFAPEADELMHIAVRGQHIERWRSPRSDFPMNKQGYHQWRSALYEFHAGRVVELMQQAGYEKQACERVYNAVAKKQIKRNPDSQLVEDIASLVFIEHYMLAFAQSKPDYDEQKWIGILQRTWQKMSPQAHDFVLAGHITLPAPLVPLIEKALSGE